MSKGKDNQISSFEKQLDRVIGWISFAEAKNAALIALNITSMAVIAEIFDKSIGLGAVTLTVFSISTVISLVSFFPNNTGAERDSDNILNYANISSLINSKSYLERHILRYEKGGEMNYENLKEDISNQIYNNSKIALIKNTLFKYALIIDIIAFATFVVYVLQVVGIVPS